jgi:hypothetical protein
MESDARLQQTIDTLLRYLLGCDWAGFDPYDVMNSPFWSRLARGRPLVGGVLTQLMRYLPFDSRRLWGIPPVRMTKTVSLIVRSHLNLERLGHDAEWHREQARRGLDWLAEQRLPGFHGACWGYSHDWQSRLMFVPKTQPALVCTVFVARAFLDAYARWGDDKDLQIARSSCDFVLEDLPRYETDAGHCFSYITGRQVLVHNANLLGAELLARVYGLTGERDLLEAALPALAFTLADQTPDGAWFYDVRRGPGSDRRWIDNFHTGFVLESLLQLARVRPADLEEPIGRGLEYYGTRFFKADGRPRRSSKADYPVDLRDCAQAVIVHSLIGDRAPAGDLGKVLTWTLDHMLLRSGLATYQHWSFWNNPPVFVRFQAWLLLALTCERLRREGLSAA